MDPGHKMRALVIEDDVEMAGLVKRLLHRRFSIEAEIASDCVSARRMLASQCFDIITLDYRLPDGAGLDLLDEITEALEHPPVIMVTGHGDEETAARSFQSRASGYVVKDSGLPTMLTEAVEKVLAEISLKKVEKELLDEKALIENALNSLPDLFLVLDIEGNLFRWNRTVGELTGYSDAELSSLNIIDLFTPEDAERISEGMQRMKSLGFTVDEFTLIEKSGEKKRYELAGRVLRSKEGVPIGFCGTGRDVTERMLTREKLESAVEERAAELEQASKTAQMSEEQFRAIVENSLDMIITFDRKGRFLHSNRASETILGYKPEEYVNRMIFELTHPDDRERLIEAHKEVMAQPGAVTSLECRFRALNGDWRTLEVAAQSFVDRHGEFRIIVNARDVTDRKEAEEELRRREQRFRLLTDNMDDVITQTDLNGILVYVSPSHQTLLGYDPEEAMGKSVFDFLELVHPDDRERTAEEITRGLETFGLSRAIYRFKHADGHYLWVESLGSPLKDENDNLVGGVITARDITERKRAEEELRRLNSELEGYARTVSHDLRSPITSIKLAGDTLARLWERREEADDIGADVMRIADVIDVSATQAEELIDDLLTLAMAGQEPDEISDVDVNATVDRIVEERAVLIEERNATVRVDDDLGTLRANPTHVYQLFGNFIDNAIKHNDKPVPVVDVRYLGSGPNGHIYIVKDNGPGIDPADVRNIFMPFFKGENGYTGIGLTIADKIIKLYDGTVRVYGNDGACFEFTVRDR